jgi:hypothetical protein
MGADLLYSFCEIQATEEEAMKNAEIFFASQPILDLVRGMEDECGISRWYGESEESLNPNEVLEFLKDCVKEVYASIGRRDCGVIMIDGTRPFYFTAGMSWGDVPSDCYDSFVVCEVYHLTRKIYQQ